MKIDTILDQIDLTSMALPEFQRGYVWNRDQVRGLMHSLYRKHPVGSLLVWVTKTESAKARGDQALQPGTVQLLLDGQQRITSLYGIIRGKPPRFFDGDAKAFTGLYFNLDDEIFEFYAQQKMKGNARWINVTELMKSGVGEFVQRINAEPELQPQLNLYINRLTAIGGIKEIDFHIDQVTGEDKTIDVVVDIFNRVNSGGTKLSKGDLALAKICAEWPEAREQMKVRLDRWKNAGFNFKLELVLRCVNAIVTGDALFSALADVDREQFEKGLKQAERNVDTLLNVISGRLGLDHDRVLGSRYSLPVMAKYLAQRGGRFNDYKERDKLLYWYVHTLLWGRYSSSVESTLNQDLAHIKETDSGALDRLVSQMRQSRGDLRLNPNDFIGWSRGARFYPLLYMLTRVWEAKDWESGINLSHQLLGQLNNLQVHHIFPQALLYKHNDHEDQKYKKSEVNALANLTFLTQDCNLQVSDRDPAEYLEEYSLKHPGAIESHWIPMDRRLWQVENYREFLTARRVLLAKAGNEFLDHLLAGDVPEGIETPAILDRERVVVGAGGVNEEQILDSINEWVLSQGLPAGEYGHEVMNSTTGEVTLLDLAWTDGLQEGLSEPVALLINEDEDTEKAANAAGFKYFTGPDEFRAYVEREILALEPAPA